MAIPLSDLLNQIALSVLQYINSKRDEYKLGRPINQESFLALDDLDSIEAFFKGHIETICAKPDRPGTDRTGRRPHLEFMISAFMHFQHQLHLSNTLEATPAQLKKFKILVAYFLSALEQLEKSPVDVYEISEATADYLIKENQPQIDEETLSDSEDEKDIFVMPNSAEGLKKYSLKSFYYQTITSQVTAAASSVTRMTRWSGDINADIGTLGRSVRKMVLSTLVNFQEVSLELQVSEIVASHIVCNKTVVIENKEAIDLRIAALEELVKKCTTEVIQQKSRNNEFQRLMNEKFEQQQQVVEKVEEELKETRQENTLLKTDLQELQQRVTTNKPMFGMGFFPALGGILPRNAANLQNNLTADNQCSSSIVELS